MAAAPLPATRKSSRVRDFTREYVSGGTTLFAWTGARNQALPHPFDDLTRDFGVDIYERMLKDSQVASTVKLYKAAILEDGVEFSPAVTDPKKEGYELAQEIHTELTDMLEYMDTALNDVLFNMLDAASLGNKVAEEVYELRNNKLMLKALKVKDRKSIAFVVDKYLNIIGILGDTSGLGVVQTVADPKDVLPREKFAILTFQPENGDPRGTSILRPAYEPWWRKRQIMPEYLKFLAQFAGPSMYAISPEGAELPRLDEGDDDGENPLALSPEQAILQTLLNFRNGTAMALPFGTEVHLIQSEGTGQAFSESLAQCNTDITKAILVQQLATEESKFMARAAAQVHQDVLSTLIHQGKQAVVRMIQHDIVRPWVSYNWGDDARKLAPTATLGEVEAENLTPLMNAVANLTRANYFAPEQYSHLDRQMGFYVRREGSQTPADLQKQQVDNQTKAANTQQKQQQQPPPQPQPQQDQKQKQNDPNATGDNSGS